VNAKVMRHLGNAVALTVVVGLALASFGDLAYAQGAHSGAHSGGASSDAMGGIEHGMALAATVLLAGLAPDSPTPAHPLRSRYASNCCRRTAPYMPTAETPIKTPTCC
jgi:hypothetical protein